MSYNSKYKSSEVEAFLDKTAELNVAAVDTSAEVDDVILEYATKDYVDNAISSAITNTINASY